MAACRTPCLCWTWLGYNWARPGFSNRRMGAWHSLPCRVLGGRGGAWWPGVSPRGGVLWAREAPRSPGSLRWWAFLPGPAPPNPCQAPGKQSLTTQSLTGPGSCYVIALRGLRCSVRVRWAQTTTACGRVSVCSGRWTRHPHGPVWERGGCWGTGRKAPQGALSLREVVHAGHLLLLTVLPSPPGSGLGSSGRSFRPWASVFLLL